MDFSSPTSNALVYTVATGLVLLVALFIWIRLRILRQQNRKLEESLRDETLTIPGLGEKITFEEAGGHEMNVNEIEVKEKRQETDYWRDEKKQETDVYPIAGLNITDENRLWLESVFQFLVSVFGNHDLKRYEVIITAQQLDIIPLTTYEANLDIVQKIAAIMDIEPGEVHAVYYNKGMKPPPYGWAEDGRLHISVYEPQRDNFGELVSEVAFQLAHIKLSNIKQPDENDSLLAEMLPLFYGFGVLLANISFTFNKDDKQWEWQSRGSFSQMEWGYMLALYATKRGEEHPDWTRELNTSVKKDMERALEFINTNRELIFSTKPYAPQSNE